jgi:hypothetical protein
VATYTLWEQGTPGADGGDGGAYTLGLQFKLDTQLYAIGCWFYKYAGNTGTHVSSLWEDDGATRIAGPVTFTGETASGWQYMPFATNPLLSVAPATYRVTVVMPNGHYAANSPDLEPDVTNGPITGIVGRYHVGSTETYPVDEFGQGNYWIDIQLSDVLPGKALPFRRRTGPRRTLIAR